MPGPAKPEAASGPGQRTGGGQSHPAEQRVGRDEQCFPVLAERAIGCCLTGQQRAEMGAIGGNHEHPARPGGKAAHGSAGVSLIARN